MSLSFRHILGMKVNSGTYATCTEQIRLWATAKEPTYVCVANVHMTMETVDSQEFSQVVNSADMVTSDGMPLVWMLKRLGLPESERVYGPELVLRVCEMAERENLNIGLYGGTDESLASFKSFLSIQFPNLNVSYSWAPPFRPLTDEEDQRVIRELASSKTNILFVGIGCPKQERWMAAHKQSIHAVQIGVGAAFDFHSGAIRQAPKWMGNAGLEWLFRLSMEPKRLWRRYVVHNPRFIVGAIFQLLKTKFSPAVALLLLPWLLAGSVVPEAAPRTYWVSQHNPAASDSNPGTKGLPFKTISTPIGLDLLEPGDSLLIESGIYREEIRPKRGGAGPNERVFIGAAKGHHVVVSGADVFGRATSYSDSMWVVNDYFPLGFFGSGTTYERELIVADGRTLVPVFNFSDLRRGTFFVERRSESDARIFIQPDIIQNPQTGPIIEISKRGSLFKPGSAWTGCGDENAPGWFYVKNITFVHAANQAQAGAVCLGTEGSVLDSVRVEWTNGVGIQVLGRNHEIVDSKSNHNGQAGINGTCRNCLLQRNETSYNNRVGHDLFWESGGGKWIGSQGLTIRYHTSIGNEGPGIWFDRDNVDIHVSYSTFENNLAAGVMVELRSEKVVLENVSVLGTRRYGWTGAGILIQAAGNVSIEKSKISDNEGAGIWVRDDKRFEGGYNRFLDNSFSNNGLKEGVDKADIQIEALDIIHLCSNQIRQPEFEERSTSIHFEIAKPYEIIEGVEASQFTCLVHY